MISIFDELASPPPGSRFDPAKDKAILDVAVKQFLRIGAVNDRAIGREIRLSHVQVAERKRTRCARIMGLFRKEWPAFFQLHSPRRPPGYSPLPKELLSIAAAVNQGGVGGCGYRLCRRLFRSPTTVAQRAASIQPGSAFCGRKAKPCSTTTRR